MTIKKIGNLSNLASKYASLANAVESGFEDAEKLAVEDFQKSQQTWTNQSPIKRTKPSRFTRRIEMTDEIYRFVDHGTDPYEITPRRGRALAFRSGYTRKTRRGRIASGSGGPSGGTVVTKRVQHPGISSGDMSKAIKKRWDKQLPKRMNRAIKRALR